MPVTSNPNAEVSVYAGAVTILIAWALSTFAGLDAPDYVDQAFTVVLIGIVLWIGRRG